MDLRVLVVMAGDRRTRLLEQLASCGIEGVPADDCEGARRILRTRRPVHVVLTDFVLPDGGGPRVLEAVTRNEVDAPTIICIPGLWVKVLEYGARKRRESWRPPPMSGGGIPSRLRVDTSASLRLRQGCHRPPACPGLSRFAP